MSCETSFSDTSSSNEFVPDCPACIAEAFRLLQETLEATRLTTPADLCSVYHFVADCPACMALAEASRMLQEAQEASRIEAATYIHHRVSNSWRSDAHTTFAKMDSEEARRTQFFCRLLEATLDSVSPQGTTFYTHSFPLYVSGNPEPTLKQSVQKPASVKVVLKDASGKVIVGFEKRGVMRFD